MFPSLVRSVEGEYWHRPRSARWYPNGWTWQTWCGVSFPDARVSPLAPTDPGTHWCAACEGPRRAAAAEAVPF